MTDTIIMKRREIGAVDAHGNRVWARDFAAALAPAAPCPPHLPRSRWPVTGAGDLAEVVLVSAFTARDPFRSGAERVRFVVLRRARRALDGHWRDYDAAAAHIGAAVTLPKAPNANRENSDSVRRGGPRRYLVLQRDPQSTLGGSMSYTIALPAKIHDRMWYGFVKQAAREVAADRITKPDALLIHGDDIGSFLGWWWREDEGTAVRFLLDYVDAIRGADPLRNYDSAQPLSYAKITEALPLALSINLSDEEADALIERAAEAIAKSDHG